MKSKRTPAKSRDRRSAPVEKTLPVESLATTSASVQTIPIQPEHPFEELLSKHRNLSSAMKAFLEPYYKSFPVFAQGPNDEADKDRFERVFRPWPKWRFRLGAELWHVIYPTIESDVFFQTLRVLNVIAFRCPTNPSTIHSSSRKGSALDRIDVRALPIIIASIYGHTNEHLEARRKSLGEKLAQRTITQEHYDQEIKRYPRGTFDKMLSDFFAQWRDSNISPFELSRAVEEARRKTFDKQGRLKETPLTSIYRVMAANWIMIENMEGPKDLTHFLLPVLGEKDFYVAYDRVKNICSRLKIKFKPPVKEI